MSKPVIGRHNAKVMGQGAATLLFAHGFGCDQNMWRLVAPAFSEEYRIVLFDHIGSGKSDWSAYDPERHAYLRGYSSDVLELIDALQLRDVIFVGHSVSAMIGMLAAIERPACFKAQIMIGPSPCYVNHGDYYGGFNRSDIDALLETMAANYYGWSSAMTPVIMGNSDRPELAAELNESFCRADPDISRRFARVTFKSDHRQDLPKLQTPTLILQCDQDAIAPKQVGAYMQQRIPNSQLVNLNATGHCPHLSAPDEVVEAISTYLKAIGRRHE